MGSRYFKPPTYSDIFPLRTPLTEDIRVAVNQSKLDQVQGPTWVDFKGGYALEFVTGADKTIKFNIQFPHSWEEGSIILPHIHWVGETTNAGDVVWSFTHSWANIAAAFPGETTDPNTVANSLVADYHNRSNFTPIDGTGKTFSSMMICSLTRTGSVGADNYGDSAYLLEFDIHLERDKLGKDYP